MRDARPADPRGEHREAARARARAARARVARLRGDRAHPARAAVLRSARPRLGKWGARKRPRVSVEHGGPRNGPPYPPAAVFRAPRARLRDGHGVRGHAAAPAHGVHADGVVADDVPPCRADGPRRRRPGHPPGAARAPARALHPLRARRNPGRHRVPARPAPGPRVGAAYAGALLTALALHGSVMAEAATKRARTAFMTSSAPLTFVYVIVGPLFEETIVRAYLMTRLTTLGLSTPTVVLASAVLQTAYHTYQGLAWALVYLPIFLTFAVYFAWRRNAVAPVLSHVTVDLVAWAAIYSGLAR